MLSFGANKNKKNIQYTSVLLLLVLAVGVTFPHSAQASFWGLGWVGDGISDVFKGLLFGIFHMVGALVSGAVVIFQWAIDPAVYSPGGLFNKASVYNMWKLIRDFLNLFFILTLLYTAFTIVFQIASNYKKTLLSIVLAALFVNFSFPLTRVIIDATNVPMYYFINLIMGSTTAPAAAGQQVLGPVLSASGLKDLLIPPQNSLSKETTVAQLLMAIVFLFVFMVTIMVLAVMLVIRMMALLILVIFSPIGFAASVIPGLKQYSDAWWDKLWKYAFFGPATMLMLYIATQFFSEIAKDDTKQNMILATQGNIASTGSDYFASMGMYSITIIMLWMAIGLANTMSIAGAGAVAGTGEKFLKWTGRKLTVSPAKFVGHKVDSKLAGSKHLSFLSPGSWALALKQRGEEQKHKDEQPIKQAAARRQDQLNQVISRFTSPIKSFKAGHGIDHTDHNFAQTQAQSGEYRKEISDVSTQSDYVINEMKAALATKNTAKADAALQILAKNNDLNDMLQGLDGARLAEFGIKNEYNDKGELIKRRVDEKGKAVVSSENMMLALQGILRESGEDNAEVLAKRLMVIGDHATGAGNFAFGGMTSFENGKFRLAKRGTRMVEAKDKEGRVVMENGKPVMVEEEYDEQAEWAGGKVKNLESQKRQTSLHPDSLFTRTSSGFGDINGKTAEAIISTFTSADVAQVDRSRDDLKQAIHDAYSNADKNPQFMAMYKENEIFKNYADAVVRMKRGKKKDADNTSDSKSQWYKDNAPGSKYNEPLNTPSATPTLKFPDVPTV